MTVIQCEQHKRAIPLFNSSTSKQSANKQSSKTIKRHCIETNLSAKTVARKNKFLFVQTEAEARFSPCAHSPFIRFGERPSY